MWGLEVHCGKEDLVWLSKTRRGMQYPIRAGNARPCLQFILVGCWRYSSDTECRGSVVMAGNQQSEGGCASAEREPGSQGNTHVPLR